MSKKIIEIKVNGSLKNIYCEDIRTLYYRKIKQTPKTPSYYPLIQKPTLDFTETPESDSTNKSDQ